MMQSNPRYRSPDDLNRRDREHYEVAKSLDGPFAPARFVSRYRDMYPSRKSGSIIPSDYCFNRDNKGNVGFPRFLLWDGGSEYLFVDQDGMGWPHAIAAVGKAAIPPPKSRERKKSAPAHRERHGHTGSSSGIRRFRPGPDASLILNPDVAQAAITGFNTDEFVQSQEESAFRALGDSFRSGEIFQQLRALNFAYRTRASLADIGIIATAIENSWKRWCDLLLDLPDLAEEVVPVEVTRELLALFLFQETNSKPRSLATKALHFAAPRTYIPVDTYAADKLGAELQAGGWSHTDGLDTVGMTAWYTDYLEVVHQIGALNGDLITDLLQTDAETSAFPKYARARGLPKLIDKILWWCGKEAREGRDARLFEETPHA